jgi:hypothetical protein
MTALEKFQAFLRDRFPLDLTDLDFGIYRLLRILSARLPSEVQIGS